MHHGRKTKVKPILARILTIVVGSAQKKTPNYVNRGSDGHSKKERFFGKVIFRLLANYSVLKGLTENPKLTFSWGNRLFVSILHIFDHFQRKKVIFEENAFFLYPLGDNGDSYESLGATIRNPIWRSCLNNYP